MSFILPLLALLAPAVALASQEDEDGASLLQSRGGFSIREARRWDGHEAQEEEQRQRAEAELSLDIVAKHHKLRKAAEGLDRRRAELNDMDDLYIAQDEAGKDVISAITTLHEVELMINDSESLPVPETVKALVAAQATVLKAAEAPTAASDYGNLIVVRGLNESALRIRQNLEFFEVTQSRHGEKTSQMLRIRKSEEKEKDDFEKLESDEDQDKANDQLMRMIVALKEERESANERLTLMTHKAQTVRAEAYRSREAKLIEVRKPSKTLVGLAGRVSALTEELKALQAQLRKKKIDEARELRLTEGKRGDDANTSGLADSMAKIREEVNAEKARVDNLVRTNLTATSQLIKQLLGLEVVRFENVTKMAKNHRAVFDEIAQDSWKGLDSVLGSVEAMLSFTREVDHVVQLALGAKNHKRRVQTVFSEEGVKVKNSVGELRDADVKLKKMISDFDEALKRGQASHDAHMENSSMGRLSEEEQSEGIVYRAVLAGVRDKEMQMQKMRQEMDKEMMKLDASGGPIELLKAGGPTRVDLPSDKQLGHELLLLCLRKVSLEILDIQDQIQKAEDDWKHARKNEDEAAEVFSSQADDVDSAIASLRDQEKRLTWEIEDTKAALDGTYKGLIATTLRSDREAPKPNPYAVSPVERRSEPASMSTAELMAEEHDDNY